MRRVMTHGARRMPGEPLQSMHAGEHIKSVLDEMGLRCRLATALDLGQWALAAFFAPPCLPGLEDCWGGGLNSDRGCPGTWPGRPQRLCLEFKRSPGPEISPVHAHFIMLRGMKDTGKGPAVVHVQASDPVPEVDGTEWDAIVIGSGLGGLGAASTLAQLAGMKCLIIEQHWVPGGAG